jgi:peptidoglycan/xylan/chitin deacetylase (PgdA/CDA1 family)
MRAIVVGFLCLVGAIAWAMSLSLVPAAKPAMHLAQAAQPAVSEPADPPAVQAPAQAVVAPAKEPAVQASAESKPAPAAATPDTKPAEPPVVAAVAPPAAKPAEPAQAPPDAKPPEAPATPPVEQTVAPPAEPAPAAPDAKPVEAQAVKPVEAATAPAPGCPGNPDALGTSRVLTLAADDVSLLGTIQYKHSLPLADHEVVLTFDDGPIPPYTNSILDTLAKNCVKATYFMVGEMAHHYPYLVRRVYNEGHSIGTHTQHHPYAMQHLSLQRVASEVNGGIASVETALGDPKALSPFFRIPGLGRTNAIEHFLEAKGLSTWSADIDTNDWWRGTTPGALIQRTMRRLNARGSGIILMHDIHPATALALPALLKELKAAGYHVVHVVTAGEHPKALPEVVASPRETENWPRVLHVSAEKTGGVMSALRHKVKVALRSRHHHRVAKRHVAERAGYTATGSVTRSRTDLY